MEAAERRGDGERVLVVGGGIAGLTAAIALTRAEVPVKVLEAAPELRAVGGALQLWVNAVAALDRLGLGAALARLGEPVEQFTIRSWRGRTLISLPLAEIARRHGSPLPHMAERAELLEALHAHLPEGTVEFGAVVAGVEERDDAVTVQLADGREERGAILVGADGLESRVRAELFPDARLTEQGYQYLRCLAEFEGFPQKEFVFTFGRGDRFGAHSVASGKVYWFGVLVAEPGSAGPRKEQLLDRFAGFPPVVRELIESADEGQIGRTDIRDLDPFDRWARGRVVLIGDAAHAMTPNLGRGAGEAIEDGVVLADYVTRLGGLVDGDRVAAALASYDALRRPKVVSVQRRSRTVGKVGSWRNPALVALREVFFRTVAGRGMAKGFDGEFAEAAAPRRTASAQPRGGA